MSKQESNRTLKLMCNVISYALMAVCVLCVWIEEFVWSGASLLGILIFSNLPLLLSPSDQQSQESKALEKDLKKELNKL